MAIDPNNTPRAQMEAILMALAIDREEIELILGMDEFIQMRNENTCNMVIHKLNHQLYDGISVDAQKRLGKLAHFAYHEDGTPLCEWEPVHFDRYIEREKSTKWAPTKSNKKPPRKRAKVFHISSPRRKRQNANEVNAWWSGVELDKIEGMQQVVHFATMNELVPEIQVKAFMKEKQVFTLENLSLYETRLNRAQLQEEVISRTAQAALGMMITNSRITGVWFTEYSKDNYQKHLENFQSKFLALSQIHYAPQK